nr:STAS domain-containing protein [Jiangella asiatica]
MVLSTTIDPSRDRRGGSVRLLPLGGCTVVRLTGNFDVAGGRTLERTLCEVVDGGHVVVDLSHVGLFSATALDALSRAHACAVHARTSLHLSGARDAVRAALAASGLDARLDHHDDLADAVEAALAARDARADQSRQNSLPSGSAIMMWSASSGKRARRA